MRSIAVLALVVLSGCRTSTNWALRVPDASKECVRDCYGSVDDTQWRTCIATCGGTIKEEACDGKPGCREIESSKVSVGWTIAFVVGCVALGGGLLVGASSQRR